MTGRSYAGTTQFGLATTGVEGLETVVPVAGIASWYEYTNSQGISTGTNVAYSDRLAWYCNGRYLDAEDYATIAEKYGNYLYQLQLDQKALNGNYGDHWATRDYTLNWANIQCPALIVHGLNDDNVRTKEFDLMYQAYQKAGVDVKLLLHQDAHLTPTYPAKGIEMYIGDELYDEILNQWFSHYLYGLDNGIENMAAVTAQSNYDTHKWDTYDSWDSAASAVLSGASAESETTTINSDYAANGVSSRNWRDVFTAGTTANSSMYTMDVPEDMIIKGSVAVDFSAAVSNLVDAPEDAQEPAAPSGQAPRGGAVDHDSMMAELQNNDGVALLALDDETSALAVTPLADRDALMVSAMLVDIALEGETFPAFNTVDSYVPHKILEEDGAWMGGGLNNFDLFELSTVDVSYKIIARGWMDLCNPNAGYDSASAAEKVSLTEGQYNDYTLYLQPNLYTVKEGHKLALVIYAYEPGKASYRENYAITLDNSTVAATIPLDEAQSSYTLRYSAENGSITSDVASGASVAGGTVVTLTAAADSGYTFSKWTVNGQDAGTDATLTITITGDTDVAAVFTRRGSGSGSGSGSSGGSSGSSTYVVSISSPANGKVTASPKNASQGTTVTLTVTPDAGYQLDTLTVTDKNGKAVSVTEKNGKYTFTMPAGAVTVKATFEETTSTGDGWPFTDVPASYWAYDSIKAAYEKGYMNGKSATIFQPDGSVTRQQLWMILARLSGAAPADMAAARDWAMSNNISDGTNPGNPVTRQQMVAILYRYATLKGYDISGKADLTSFPDSASVADYAKDAMAWSVANSIVAGTSDGTLNPTGTATRAQFATILMRFCDKMVG